MTSIPAEWFVIKRKYKTSIKRKKIQTQRYLWENLTTASKENDSASLWKIATGGLHNHTTDLYLVSINTVCIVYFPLAIQSVLSKK